MNNRKIIIISKDGTSFELDYAMAKQSQVLLLEMEKNINLEPVRFELGNINSSILERIVSYLVYHKEIEDTEKWDYNFINKFTGYELIDLIWSANYLKINDLLEIGKNRLLNVFDNNDTDKVRKILNIPPDFTEEEDDNILKKFKWTNL